MLVKNTASQGVYLFAYLSTTGAAKTGDSANITGSITKDGAASAATATANPTEIGGGVYWQPLSQAETNANVVALYWSSSTSNVIIGPLFVLTDRSGVVVATNNDKTGYTASSVTDKTGYSLSQSFPSNFASLAITAGGIVQADLQTIKTQAVTASAGVTFPTSIASPTNITAGTIATVTTLTNLPTAPTDWLSAAAVSAAAVTKIQSGLSTYAGGDTSGTTTLLARLTTTRAGYLDSLNTGVPILLTQTGLSPRDLGAIADASLTVGDALVCAIAGAAGKESTSGTTYLVKTPSTGTAIRSFTLDSATTPTSRS